MFMNYCSWCLLRFIDCMATVRFVSPFSSAVEGVDIGVDEVVEAVEPSL